MNAPWFLCKVKYEKTLENGALKRVVEPYLVDALNFTEAERRLIEEVKPFMSGIFEVTDITRARFADIFESPDERADRFFKAKLLFVTLDERSGKEKQISQQVLIQASDLRDALRRLDEAFKGTSLDYTIASIAETAIVAVFHYAPAQPGTKSTSKE